MSEYLSVVKFTQIMAPFLSFSIGAVYTPLLTQKCITSDRASSPYIILFITESHLAWDIERFCLTKGMREKQRKKINALT